MELILLKLVAFLRPVLFIELGTANLFDLAAMLTFGLLAVVFLAKAAVQKSLELTLLDFLIVLFVVWALSVYVIYIDKASVRDVAKLIIPFLTYTIARNALANTSQYISVLSWMLLGFAPPVLLSVAFIATGRGMEEFGENYWTGIPRWEGVFAGSHNLGHNMTFVIMAITVFFFVWRQHRPETPIPRTLRALLVGLALGAVYCLWMSQVRTALMGLIIFAGSLLFFVNRKVLLMSAIGGAITVVALWPILFPYLFPDLVMIEKSGYDLSYAGSGRPLYWKNNLEKFSALPIDRQLAGIGIGNKVGFQGYSGEGFVDSHNDILDVLMQTGIVGFLLFAALQIALLKEILRLSGPVRYCFFAIFIAVTAMNLASNSYINRFGLAQMYYLLLVYVGLQAANFRRIANVAPGYSGISTARARE